MPYAFTITEEHRKAQTRAIAADPNAAIRDTIRRQAGICKSVIGHILPCDIGKRVYRTASGLHQVENTEQMLRRLGAAKDV